jgi:pSer/pThr/pTyr-binding forkhead associated (FHA) protein
MSVQIQSDATIPVGRVRSRIAPEALDRQVEAVPATSRLPIVRPDQSGLRITLPSGQTLTFSQNVISIGRDATNDVILADTRVSRRHAEIDAGAGKLQIHDLQSTNGTWVNGAEIRQHTALTPPARVSLGGVEIHVDTARP